VNKVFGILVAAAGLAQADLFWNFAQTDSRPGGQGGIYAYSYPTDGSRHTANHTASLQRVADANGTAALLKFDLDGSAYPSAGFGLMFSETQPLDLRGLTGVRFHITSDKPRKIRMAFASRLPDYKAAFDTGVSFGRDIRATSTATTVSFGAGDLSWPQWATDSDIPATVTDAEILASTWAIQFNVSCEDANGKCANDSGWIRLDSLRLMGVGTDWAPPSPGDCSGDELSFSRFDQPVPKRNGRGGWWYAYTDLHSSDTAAMGASLVLSAPDTNNPGSWVPDSTDSRAYLAFHLQKIGSYSGYADLESQITAPDDSGHPQSANLPGLKSISFALAFDSGFPTSLGGVTLHAKKSGSAFAGGRDHQIRIPFDTNPRTWCIDFDSLQQPAWASWVPFTPDSLLSLSWEVKLQGSSTEALGGFSLRDVKLWSSSVGVRSRVFSGWSVRRVGNQVEIAPPSNWVSEPLQVDLVDASGRVVSSLRGSPGPAPLRLSTPGSRILWARISGRSGFRTLPVPPEFGR
jgi:hypothetical protein